MYVKNNHPQALAAGKTLIGFNWVGGKEQEGDLPSFDSRSPFHQRDTVGVFPECSERDVEKALRAAKEAAKEWHLSPTQARADMLAKSGEVLAQHQDCFLNILHREVGLLPEDAEKEVHNALSCFEHIKKQPFTQPAQHPLGVIGIVSSTVSPLAAPLGAVLPALLAGNTVVWKPSCHAPTIAYLMARCWMDSGLPGGVVNIMNGKGHAACGKAMVDAIERRDFQGFAFSGSLPGARTLSKHCGKSLVPFHGASQNGSAMLVMADADLDAAAQAACRQMLLCNGQSPLALHHLFVHQSVISAFRQKLMDCLTQVHLGPQRKGPFPCGPLCSPRLLTAFEEHLAHGHHLGHVLCTGGKKPLSSTEEDLSHGLYVQPCLWQIEAPRHPLPQTPVCGPTASLYPVPDLEQALQWAHSLTHLAGCLLWGQEQAKEAFLAHCTTPQCLAFNDTLTDHLLWEPMPALTQKRHLQGIHAQPEKPLHPGKYPASQWALIAPTQG